MRPQPKLPDNPAQAHAHRCRAIEAGDLAEVADLLAEGFPGRNLASWQQGLATLSTRRLDTDRPRWGYVLEQGGKIDGVLLLIHAPDDASPDGPRCNVSSWYVKPEARALAHMLVKQSLHIKQMTYTNISAAPHTLPLLKPQGYQLYSAGSLLTPPLLGGGLHRKVRAFDAARDQARLPPHEYRMLCDHADLGCLVVVGEDLQGLVPFVLNRPEARRWPANLGGTLSRLGWARLRRIPLILARRLLRIRPLVYCRDASDLARFAHPLGRWLLLHHGITLLRLDTPAPVPGLVGRFSPGRDKKFYRGLKAPRLNDLAYSEIVYFGS
ncbi:MAG: hypothetical protein KGQ37_04760 [Hyphomicrobiales bacterium]|nr:hypothetical protein [Hyphomicrobiales bacterium]